MLAISFGALAKLARLTILALLFVTPCVAGLAVRSQNLCFALALLQSGQDAPPTTFTLTGFVRNQSNQTVSGVRVSVTDENSLPIYSGFVETNGRFTVKGLRQGRFILRIETTGSPYDEYSQPLELQSLRQFGGNEMIPVDVILKYKKGNGPPSRTGSIFAQDVPKAARTEFERGTSNIKSNKTEAGITSLKKAIEIFPDYFDALEMLGTEYVKSNQHEAALPFLTHAIEINKRASKSLYALGVVHLRLNQLPEAIEMLEKSAQIDSNNPNTQMMLGLAYGNSGAPDKSEAAFKKALQLGGPAAAEAHYYLTGLYNKQERYREAWKELELFLRESKNVKDPGQIKAMIANLKEKEKAQAAHTANSTPPASQPANTAVSSQPANAPPAPSTIILNAGVNDSAGPVGESATPAPVEPKPDTNTATLGPVPLLPPEYVELLRQTEASGAALHQQLLDYTYQLKKIHRVLNERGNPTHMQEQVFEAYPVRGEHVMILLSRDGQASKNLAEERKRAAKQLEEAERQRNSEDSQEKSVERETDSYVSAGVSGVYQGKTGYVSLNVSAVLRSCEFFSPRTEKIGDREMLVLNYRHRAGVKLTRNHAYIAGLVGTVWIDQADKVLTRLEGWPVTAAAFDLVQSTAPREEAALIYQQARRPDGIWFPSMIRMNAGGRTDLFDGLNWDVVFEFSNYQRFNTSANENLNVLQKPKP